MVCTFMNWFSYCSFHCIFLHILLNNQPLNNQPLNPSPPYKNPLNKYISKPNLKFRKQKKKQKMNKLPPENAISPILSKFKKKDERERQKKIRTESNKIRKTKERKKQQPENIVKSHIKHQQFIFLVISLPPQFPPNMHHHQLPPAQTPFPRLSIQAQTLPNPLNHHLSLNFLYLEMNLLTFRRLPLLLLLRHFHR